MWVRAYLENPSPAPKQQVYTLPRPRWAVPHPYLAGGAALHRCQPPQAWSRDEAREDAWGGGSRTSLTVCASETEHRRASLSPPRAAARPPGSGSAGPRLEDEWGSPPPQGDPARPPSPKATQVSPVSPLWSRRQRDAETKRQRFPKLACPPPQNKGAPRPFPPPARAATSGSGRPGGIVQHAGSAPARGVGGAHRNFPLLELQGRTSAIGGHRQAPGPEKFAPLPGVHSPRHEPCNLWPRSVRTGGSTVTKPGPRGGRRGPGAPEQPRAAPGPPPSPREKRALESFGGEWRPEGAAAAAGRGRWRLVAPERRDWGGWAGSGGGGRGRDGGRDRHSQVTSAGSGREHAYPGWETCQGGRQHVALPRHLEEALYSSTLPHRVPAGPSP